MARALLVALLFIPLGRVCAQGTLQVRADSLERLLTNTARDTNRVNLLNRLAHAYNQTGDAGKELEHAKSALELADSLQWDNGMGAALLHIGSAHEHFGDYPGALQHYAQAMHLFEQAGNRTGIAKTLNNTGIVRWHQGDQQGALKDFLAAKKLQEELGDRKGMARSLNGIAIVHKAMGDPDQALKDYQAALSIMEESGDQEAIAKILGNIGITYHEMGEHEEGLRLLKLAHDIQGELGNRHGIASSYNNLGVLATSTGDRKEALKNYMAALRVREEIRDSSGIAWSCLNIGTTYVGMGTPAEGRKWFLKALDIAQRIGNKDMIRDAYLALSESAVLLRDYLSAYEYYVWSIMYRDSLYNEENTKELVRIQMQHEFDRKEAADQAEQDRKEAVAAEHLRRRELQRNASIGGGLLVVSGGLLAFRLHRKRNTERFEKETAQLENKALRAQMNPHFIGNAMQSIKSYMNASEAERAGDLLVKFDRIMRRTLNNSAKKEVTLEEDLNVLRAYLEFEQERTQNRFQYRMVVGPDLLQREPLVPPLLIQPFLENAIEHGILPLPPDVDGLLELVIHEHNGSLVISIKDNGVGRNHKTLRAAPADDERGSMSTDITRARLALIEREKNRKADMRIIDLPQGTEVVIELPLELAA